MFPLSDGLWTVFLRGMVFGSVGGIVLILLFFWTGGKYAQLAWARPLGLVYFLAGVEIGIALIGTIVFLGINALHGGPPRVADQSKQGGV
jgi:hypothetical protein